MAKGEIKLCILQSIVLYYKSMLQAFWAHQGAWHLKFGYRAQTKKKMFSRLGQVKVVA